MTVATEAGQASESEDTEDVIEGNPFQDAVMALSNAMHTMIRPEFHGPVVIAYAASRLITSNVVLIADQNRANALAVVEVLAQGIMRLHEELSAPISNDTEAKQ